MTFNELVDQVILFTNRPDLGLVSSGGDGQIPQIVLSSTLAAHTSDMFLKDVVESDVVFTTPAYLQNLDSSSLVRFRSLYYFRKWDISEGTPDSAGNPALSYGAFGNNYLPPSPPQAWLVDPLTGSLIPSEQQFKMLTIIDTQSMFDSYQRERVDICYSAGSTIRMKSSTLLTVGKIGYFSYPDMDIANNGANFSSWIANDYPFAIIWNAVALISSAIGELETAKNLLRPANPRSGDPGGLATQAFTALKMGNIELGGR